MFSTKDKECEQKVADKKAKYTVGSIQAFISPRWTLEYCIALSCLRDKFHKAIHYGRRILNSNKYSLTLTKINDADNDVASEIQKWGTLSGEEIAYKIYSTMLDDNGKSSLKAVVAQCLASMLKWEISYIPDGITQEKMFDLDMYRYQINEKKRIELKKQIESDGYLKYIVDAIKYATGVQ